MNNIRQIIDSWNLSISTDTLLLIVFLTLGILLTVLILYIAVKIDDFLIAHRKPKKKKRKRK